MGGPNLEVFKFATYVFLPLLVMAHYGNPEWYAKNVLPVSPSFSLNFHGGVFANVDTVCGVWSVQGEDIPAGGEPRQGVYLIPEAT